MKLVDKLSKRYVTLCKSPPQPKQDLLTEAFAGIKHDRNPKITLPNCANATETIVTHATVSVKRTDQRQ